MANTNCLLFSSNNNNANTCEQQQRCVGAASDCLQNQRVGEASANCWPPVDVNIIFLVCRSYCVPSFWSPGRSDFPSYSVCAKAACSRRLVKTYTMSDDVNQLAQIHQLRDPHSWGDAARHAVCFKTQWQMRLIMCENDTRVY